MRSKLPRKSISKNSSRYPKQRTRSAAGNSSPAMEQSTSANGGIPAGKGYRGRDKDTVAVRGFERNMRLFPF